MRRASRETECAGFSLVEVTLSIGLVAFCMVALLGLLPVGLGATGSASRQSEGARLMEQFASAIRGAVEVQPGHFSMVGLGGAGGLSWQVGGMAQSQQGRLDSNGDAPSSTFPAMLAYRIDLIPPQDTRPASYGMAIVRVAWPAAAEFKAGGSWNEGEWEGAQGEMEAFVMFRAE